MPWWFCRGPGDSWHLQSLLWQPTVVEGRITWCDHHDANIWCKHMMQYVKNVMFLFFSFDVWVLWILMQFLTSISFFYQQWIILVLTRIELRGGGQLGDELWPLSFCHQIQRPNYLKFKGYLIQPQNTFVVSMPSRPLQVVKTTSWGKAKASIQQQHCGFKKD